MPIYWPALRAEASDLEGAAPPVDDALALLEGDSLETGYAGAALGDAFTMGSTLGDSVFGKGFATGSIFGSWRGLACSAMEAVQAGVGTGLGCTAGAGTEFGTGNGFTAGLADLGVSFACVG